MKKTLANSLRPFRTRHHDLLEWSAGGGSADFFTEPNQEVQRARIRVRTEFGEFRAPSLVVATRTFDPQMGARRYSARAGTLNSDCISLKQNRAVPSSWRKRSQRYCDLAHLSRDVRGHITPSRKKC